tara:strand:+ start:1063 stop:1296 length:234 start_codon:yes stop_codon:yes gene_type:complete
LLKTGQYLISEIEERPDEETDCILINPKLVIGFIPDFVLENFIPYSYQKQIPIRSSDIITIVDPMDSLLKLYRDAIT